MNQRLLPDKRFSQSATAWQKAAPGRPTSPLDSYYSDASYHTCNNPSYFVEPGSLHSDMCDIVDTANNRAQSYYDIYAQRRKERHEIERLKHLEHERRRETSRYEMLSRLYEKLKTKEQRTRDALRKLRRGRIPNVGSRRRRKMESSRDNETEASNQDTLKACKTCCKDSHGNTPSSEKSFVTAYVPSMTPQSPVTSSLYPERLSVSQFNKESRLPLIPTPHNAASTTPIAHQTSVSYIPLAISTLPPTSNREQWQLWRRANTKSASALPRVRTGLALPTVPRPRSQACFGSREMIQCHEELHESLTIVPPYRWAQTPSKTKRERKETQKGVKRRVKSQRSRTPIEIIKQPLKPASPCEEATKCLVSVPSTCEVHMSNNDTCVVPLFHIRRCCSELFLSKLSEEGECSGKDISLCLQEAITDADYISCLGRVQKRSSRASPSIPLLSNVIAMQKRKLARECADNDVHDVIRTMTPFSTSSLSSQEDEQGDVSPSK